MDSLTTHYVARELDARWRDRRIAACTLDRATRSIRLAIDQTTPIRIDLAARTPTVLEDGAERAASGILDGWLVRSVEAPVDDRRLLVSVEKPGKFRGSASRGAVIEVSLMPSARAAVVRESNGHRFATLGAELPPVSEARPLLDAPAIAAAAARADASALMAGRWMSPWLARWLIDDASRVGDVAGVLERLPAAEPSRCGEHLRPFPWCADASPVASLIAPAAALSAPESTRREDWRERALERMRRELARAAEAPRLRQAADIVLSLGEVEAPSAITLADGSLLQLDREPGDNAVVVAERLYAAVRSMERALEALPARIAATESAGERDAEPRRKPAADSEAWQRERAYRRYRSSGGLDIWVGRGAKSNDVLTFRDAAPDDVWLHARDSAGAHVVLRWQADSAPPARDLEEAATLAAWHSRARGSTVVPVDWTRRKYVRKPRGGAPGLVIMQRADTVFVRPTADAERKLRAPV